MFLRALVSLAALASAALLPGLSHAAKAQPAAESHQDHAPGVRAPTAGSSPIRTPLPSKTRRHVHSARREW